MACALNGLVPLFVTCLSSAYSPHLSSIRLFTCSSLSSDSNTLQSWYLGLKKYVCPLDSSDFTYLTTPRHPSFNILSMVTPNFHNFKIHQDDVEDPVPDVRSDIFYLGIESHGYPPGSEFLVIRPTVDPEYKKEPCFLTTQILLVWKSAVAPPTRQILGVRNDSGKQFQRFFLRTWSWTGARGCLGTTDSFAALLEHAFGQALLYRRYLQLGPSSPANALVKLRMELDFGVADNASTAVEGSDEAATPRSNGTDTNDSEWVDIGTQLDRPTVRHSHFTHPPFQCPP